MNRVLTDVGASLTDVFGADRIVWVEGPTEHVCFPKLLEAETGKLPLGLQFTALRNTGDLEARAAKSEAVWEIYERLSGGTALLPPALAFSFDREGRSPQQISDLKKRSAGKAHFLPRATYENFLIHPAAIAATLNDEFTRYSVSNLLVTEDQVKKWLSVNGDKYARDSKSNGNYADANWVRECDAPQLLSDLFADLSKATLAYHKLTHSVALTEWLLSHDRTPLIELRKYVDSLI